MIRGQVSADAVASIELEIKGLAGSQLVRVAIDTGFDGELMLPTSLVQSLQLKDAGVGEARLADGTMLSINHYLAVIHWNGAPKLAMVIDSGSVALMGMTLMQGSRLTINVMPDGDVTIDELP